MISVVHVFFPDGSVIKFEEVADCFFEDGVLRVVTQEDTQFYPLASVTGWIVKR